MIALRISVAHSNEYIDAWREAVMKYDQAERELGRMWRAPQEWHHRGIERAAISDALTREGDALVACCRVLAEWIGVGRTDTLLPVSSVDYWMREATARKRRAPVA